MVFEYIEYNKRATDENLVDDLKRVAQDLNQTSLSIHEYELHGSYNPTTITRRFGTWNKALVISGLELRNRGFTEQELLDNLERVWRLKGKQPSRRDMDNKSYSSISSGAYLRKYKNWSNALKSFIEYINNESTILMHIHLRLN